MNRPNKTDSVMVISFVISLLPKSIIFRTCLLLLTGGLGKASQKAEFPRLTSWQYVIDVAQTPITDSRLLYGREVINKFIVIG